MLHCMSFVCLINSMIQMTLVRILTMERLVSTVKEKRTLRFNDCEVTVSLCTTGRYSTLIGIFTLIGCLSKACSSLRSSRIHSNQLSGLQSQPLGHQWYQGWPTCSLSAHCSLGAMYSRLTLGTTFSFFPWLYSDLATAVSKRWSVLMSSFCIFSRQISAS